uniref:BTB domain and CNC homolog 2 n=1 Tax=Piliocolobus tephrosceles TaxID=591936 RepID=A0A8C9H0X9_9PRIM
MSRHTGKRRKTQVEETSQISRNWNMFKSWQSQGVNGMSVDEKPDSPMYVYESTVHCTNILLGLNDQRKKDILCDVTLIVERKEFRAHRAVLAACSEYFWQALVGQTKNDLVVSLPEEEDAESVS